MVAKIQLLLQADQLQMNSLMLSLDSLSDLGSPTRIMLNIQHA
jgi:hypothetical protein